MNVTSKELRLTSNFFLSKFPQLLIKMIICKCVVRMKLIVSLLSHVQGTEVPINIITLWNRQCWMLWGLCWDREIKNIQYAPGNEVLFLGPSPGLFGTEGRKGRQQKRRHDPSTSREEECGWQWWTFRAGGGRGLEWAAGGFSHWGHLQVLGARYNVTHKTGQCCTAQFSIL